MAFSFDYFASAGRKEAATRGPTTASITVAAAAVGEKKKGSNAAANAAATSPSAVRSRTAAIVAPSKPNHSSRGSPPGALSPGVLSLRSPNAASRLASRRVTNRFSSTGTKSELELDSDGIDCGVDTNDFDSHLRKSNQATQPRRATRSRSRAKKRLKLDDDERDFKPEDEDDDSELDVDDDELLPRKRNGGSKRNGGALTWNGLVRKASIFAITGGDTQYRLDLSKVAQILSQSLTTINNLGKDLRPATEEPAPRVAKKVWGQLRMTSTSSDTHTVLGRLRTKSVFASTAEANHRLDMTQFASVLSEAPLARSNSSKERLSIGSAPKVTTADRYSMSGKRTIDKCHVARGVKSEYLYEGKESLDRCFGRYKETNKVPKTQYELIHVPPNPQGATPGEKVGVLCKCNECNFTWDTFHYASGTYGSSDFRFGFMPLALAGHHNNCGKKCKCGFDIEQLVERYGGNLQNAMVHISSCKAVGPFESRLEELREYKAKFGTVAVKYRGHAGDDVWTAEKCGSLYRFVNARATGRCKTIEDEKKALEKLGVKFTKKS